MNVVKNTIISITLGLTSLSASAALLQVHEKALLKSCQVLNVTPAALEATSCSTYINGFLDGALVTDANNADELKDVANSGFMERALRTRLGERATEQSFLHFCVPKAMAKAEVIETLAPYLSKTIADADQLKSSIFQGLKQEFPCPK
jgi:hypothetical protein